MTAPSLYLHFRALGRPFLWAAYFSPQRSHGSAAGHLPRLPLARHRWCIRRCRRGPRLGLRRRVGQAFAAEAIAECIRRGGLSEAESNINLLDLVSIPAAADWDASFTVKCINENTAKGSQRKCEFDHMREVPFVSKADDLALATSHLAHSSSACASPRHKPDS